MISLVAGGFSFSAARADDPLVRSVMGSHTGYIVSEKYASEHKADLAASIPGPVKIDGFWTPTEQDIAVADRVLRESIHGAIKDPTQLFPDLTQNADSSVPDSIGYERNELTLVSRNYESYSRQFVGVVIDGQKLIFCNYSEGTKVDPAIDYIFIQKVFVPDGTVHFLQCRFEPELKTCSNVSIIGSWQARMK